MGQLTLVGQLVAAPPSSGDQTFPSGTTMIPFASTPSPKSYTVDTGRNNAQVNSPNAYAALAGVGAGSTVSAATTLYIRTSTAMLVRLSFGATVLADIPILGVFMMEFDPSKPLTLLEIKGAGAVEYYAAGNQ